MTGITGVKYLVKFQVDPVLCRLMASLGHNELNDNYGR